MKKIWKHHFDLRLAGVGLLLIVLAVPLMLAPGAAASKVRRSGGSRAGAPTDLLLSGVEGSSEVVDEAIPCEKERPAWLGGDRTKGAACPRLPEKIAPASSGPKSHGSGSSPGIVSQLVTNEAGDSIEISSGRPGTAWFEASENTWYTDCSLTMPNAGSFYTPCGYVTFYDAGWATSEKAPGINVVEDAVYDACGTLVTSDKTENWHVVGAEYTLSGWHSSHHTEAPAAEPAECLGTWRMIYTFTETFSDKETLTDSIEVPFGVGAGPLTGSESWGGGNPSELPCRQACEGDPVNTATGEFYESRTDLAIPGRGPGLNLTRTYSSSAAQAGAASVMGRGWAFPYDMSLTIDPETGDATVVNGNGSRTQFVASAKGFLAPPRILADLVENEDGTYSYTVKARTIYRFDSAGKLISIGDLNGEETTFAYAEGGRLQTATDGSGRTFTFNYNEAGKLKSVEDSTGRSVGYGYNGAGELTEVTDVRGGHERFTYNEEGQLLTREDARENLVLTNTYDGSGRILTQIDGLENETTYSYSGAENGPTYTEVTDPRGYVTRYRYENGILAKRINGLGTSDEAIWTYEYDPLTLGLSAVTDPNGHTIRQTFDASGKVTSTEDPLGHRTESVYDSLGDLEEYTDASGVTTTNEYDERGNLLKSSTPLLGSEPAETRTTEYTYGDEAHPGDPTEITDPNGHVTQFNYDAAGNLESTIDAAGDEITYTYNARGNRLSEVSGRGNAEGAEPGQFTTTYTYDLAGHRLTATDPLGGEREWTYDADGNVKTETDANGHTTTFSYNAANQQVAVERPDGQTDQTSYDADGNVEAKIDGLEHSTTFKYDPLDHLEGRTDALSRTTSYVYDGAGILGSEKDPMGRTTTYVHNAAGELTAVEYGSEPTKDVEYGYDAIGRRTSMSDATGESIAEYDSLGRLTATTGGNGDTTEFDYDLAGNQIAITYPNSKTVNREYDSANRLESVSDWLSNTTSFAYDADSNLTSTTFPAGTGNIDEYGYDRADRISGVQMKKGSTAVAALAYTRDKAGQIESLTSQGLPGAKEEAFGYDEDSRLTKAGSEGFAYNNANNLTELAGKTSTFDAANQLSSRAGVSFGYNAVGERTSEALPAATYVSSFGSSGTGNGQFYKPGGIARDSKGNLWVVDWNYPRVQKFNAAGAFQFSFGSNGTKNGQLYDPSGIAIDSEGHIWVVDWANGGRVQEFSESGKYMTSFGKGGSGNGEFELPEAIAIDSTGNIWVADCCTGRIQEFSNKGKFIKKIGTHGTAQGQIWSPLGIAFDKSGNLWVADYGNKRIEEFTAEGKFLKQFGTKGSSDGQFSGPGALSIDSEGHIWVVDGENGNRVEEFTQSGEFLGKFGSTGSGEAQFKFEIPMGIVSDSAGNIWVTDGGNQRVQHWQMAGPKATSTYKYDQAGNLTAVTRPKIGESPAIEESYTYDGGGLRASQTISGTTTDMTWDQSGELPLLLNDGSTNYIYGPGGLPIEQISGTTPTYYHHDQLGSTRMLTNASGEATGTFSYSAYGTLTGKTGTQTTPFGFAGQYTNASGLQYLRARTYDPATGQFLSKDPAAEAPSYGYGEESPLQFVDPSGRCGLSPDEWLGNVTPWSEDNCAYQATKAAVELLGGDPAMIATVAGSLGTALTLVPATAPLGAGLLAVSSVASAYAAGEEAGNGEELQAAIDALGSVLGGSATAERFLKELAQLAPTLAGESAVEQREALIKLLDEAGALDLAASVANTLCPLE
jgi:RHS repeat-associated protein